METIGFGSGEEIHSQKQIGRALRFRLARAAGIFFAGNIALGEERREGGSLAQQAFIRGGQQQSGEPGMHGQLHQLFPERGYFSAYFGCQSAEHFEQ